MNSKISRPFSLVRLTALFCAVFVQQLFAANWYVDSAATGTSNGQSWTTAWKTMAAISWTSVAAGDVIWVRGGPYNERVNITKGGSSAAARITLKGVGSPVVRGFNGGANINYVAIIGFGIVQLSSANNYPAIAMNGNTGWLIQDNVVHDTYSNGIVGAYGTVNVKNIVRHNQLYNVGLLSGGAAIDAGMIDFAGNFNLIEYNTFGSGLDRTRAIGTGNIIRNNLDTGANEIDYPSSSPYPYHTDFFQAYSGGPIPQQILVERNFMRDLISASHNGHFFILQDDVFAGVNWVVIRLNITTRIAEALYIFKSVTTVSIYNNTANAIQNDASSPFQNPMGFDSPTGGDAFDFRNNSYVNSPNTIDNAGIIPLSNRPTNFTADWQHRFGTGVLPSTPTPLHNIDNLDPKFNTGLDNFTLQATSPLKSAGGSTTTASGAGSNSTSLTVTNSKRLFDGWGIADADWIKVGASGYAQISSINYATNVVTLASPLSWNSGDNVFVKGTEDIGALPYAFAKSFTVTDTSPALVTGANTLSATVDNPDAVRMVEFLVDGLPVGLDYTAPYSASYVSDGTPHVVIARAYAAWATQTLAVETSGALTPPSNAVIQIIP